MLATIPELIDIIVQYLYYDDHYVRGGQPELLACLQVNSKWFESASRILWSRSAVAGSVAETLDSIKDDYRRSIYAHSVEHVKINLEPTIYSTEFTCPRLKHLSIVMPDPLHHPSPWLPKSYPHIQRYLTPTLETVTIVLYLYRTLGIPAMPYNLFEIIRKHCPTVEIKYKVAASWDIVSSIDPVPDEEVEQKSEELVQFLAQGPIRRLSLQLPLWFSRKRDLVEAVGKNKNIEELNLMAMFGLKDELATMTIFDKDLFSNLKSLRCWSPLEPMPSFWSAVSNIERLEVNLSVSEGTLEYIFHKYTNLRTLNAVVHVSGGEVFDLKGLKTLARTTKGKLEELSVRVSHGINDNPEPEDWTDHDMIELATLSPNLQYLVLDLPTEPVVFTSAALSAFSRYCPYLEVFQLATSCSGRLMINIEPLKNMKKPLFPRLRSFAPQLTPVYKPDWDDLPETVAWHFPRVVTDDIEVTRRDQKHTYRR